MGWPGLQVGNWETGHRRPAGYWPHLSPISMPPQAYGGGVGTEDPRFVLMENPGENARQKPGKKNTSRKAEKIKGVSMKVISVSPQSCVVG